MAEQLRAIRTRQTILSAAAKIFEEQGYQAATISQILTEAGVTKGALYFHFHSKEDLAQGVLSEQDQRIIVPMRASKVQEIVDVVMLHAHRLQTDPMVRAGVRLTMDQQTQNLDRSGPFLRWGEVGLDLLQQAKAQGELLPHISPPETAEVIVGSFAGIQSMSQAVCEYRDLVVRVSALMRHLLPSAVMPSVLASLDLSEGRGAKVYAEALKAADLRDVLETAS
ncbi:TetR family transcriptional regulator [Streptomyces sp. KhCrAH-43]|uniref:ScbR family autoregulator-binding transcription factor n=1 Tax=Streptomyces TaxID=1883 RepID=UPI00037EEF22|nr:ScbR family autoregulator-binding transcription factor [Streptomyces sp. KhCrAH-43]MYS37232.1 TetR family transcriptional regulator [Streptomyces sp. SID4920]MYX63973.1 TetR family transcriptional regulator [Streptomyces sp. SID8373]RAJ47899.1 TetR family transcriptional regulator [Streptomyces sp. KhCrAH-43]